MLLSLSWKNVWRNKGRSAVLILATALGILGGVFTMAFMQGMSDQLVRSAVDLEVSDLQMHHPQFLQNAEIQYLITNTDSILTIINAQPAVSAACKRLLVPAMANSSFSASGVVAQGIMPQQESKVTNILTHLTRGSFLDDQSKNPILISEKLAASLHLHIRNKLVLTLQTADSILTGSAFRIVGLFRSENSTFDADHVFVRYTDLQALAHLPGTDGHEIAIRLVDHEQADAVSGLVSGQFPHLRVQTWRQIKPELEMMSSLMEEMFSLFLLIILVALTFSIVNTMLMAVFERRREIGMLMAIGMRKKYIFFMILVETMVLSLSGAALGMVASAGLIGYFGATGIDLSFVASGLSAMGFSTRVYPHIDTSLYGVLTLLVAVAAIAASLYPAWRVLRIDPADALRTE